jgi:ABC-2 type transport system ATP-binding protein
MQRRLDVACGLIHNPPILMMDEPTAGLDPVLREDFWHLINQLRDSGRTIIFSSQILEEIELLCDSLVIIEKGKVIANGSMDTVRSSYTKNYEVRIRTQPGNYEVISQKIASTQHSQYWYTKHPYIYFVTMDPHDALTEIVPLLDGIGERLVDIDIEHPHLDEVFANLIGGSDV